MQIASTPASQYGRRSTRTGILPLRHICPQRVDPATISPVSHQLKITGSYDHRHGLQCESGGRESELTIDCWFFF